VKRDGPPVTGERWERAALVTGALLAGLAVASGAFGAHALRQRMTPADQAVWETAARYQMYHALALLLTARLLARRTSLLLPAAGWLFSAGIVLFSGSLYVLALTGQRWIGMLTPLGGVALLAGWACLAAGSLRPATT
jgi:uncharacterized membrane protein YgdD (TMEM256/DUF423 family)